MSINHSGLAAVLRQDGRYTLEAYEFLFHALHHTQKLLNRVPTDPADRFREPAAQHHVSGPELLRGVRDLALREFGLMACTVFRLWGVRTTDDVGNMVFNLIDAGLMSKNAEDSREDFHAVFDLDQTLQGYRIELDEVK